MRDKTSSGNNRGRHWKSTQILDVVESGEMKFCDALEGIGLFLHEK